MQALEPRIFDAVWRAVEGYLPPRPQPWHPLGCHRPRVPDRQCFYGLVVRLVTGCSWRDAGRLVRVGATTLRRRRSEWLGAGVFEKLCEEAICAYDKVIGLDLTEVALDGSTHKAPCGGEGTGPNPTDRAKIGWKWSIVTDTHGVPIGWAIDGANRHDSILLPATLHAVAARGPLVDVETLHLDRGYDSSVVRNYCAKVGLDDVAGAKKRKNGSAKGTKNPQPLGLRWPVERTNAWFSSYGQLRRNTDRFIRQRLAEIALAVTFVLTIKLFVYADRWNR